MSKDIPSRKEQIFDKALALVAELGYENVSMRDIADAVGIKSSSIYNHYSNKEHILESFYDYYLKTFTKRRLPEEEVKRIIREGTIEDIARLMPDGSFVQLGEHEAVRMMLLTKVIYTRMFFDPKAGEIYHATTADAKLNAQKKLDYGIEIGRFVPFQTDFYAHIMEVLYENMGILAFSNPDYQTEKLKTESKVAQWVDSALEVESQMIQWVCFVLEHMSKPEDVYEASK